MREELLWGIDLGGTKIEGVVVSRTSPAKPKARVRIDTEASQGYEHIVSRISHLVTLLEQESGAKASAIGIGTPGTIDPAKDAIKNSNTVCLNGKPLHHAIEKLMKVPVKLMNDANCFALAEQRFGAARGKQNIFGVIMGTGVGGGVIIGGKPLFGLHGIGGEWGHNVVDSNGELCYCGKRGCLEKMISGPALESFYEKISGTKRKLKDISDRVHEDAAARQTVTRLVDIFSQAIAVVINIIDPDAVVLGGGASNTPALYQNIQAKILPHVFNHEVRTPIIKAELGDSAGVFGAALLWADEG